MDILNQRASTWLGQNRDGLRNYLEYNKENLALLPEFKCSVDWLYERRYSLQYFLVGRDGPYSDALRDLKDILHLASKSKR